MKAVVFDGELKVLDIEKPKPKFREVLIKTSLGGICNTDYEITKGYMGFNGVLGHEFVGVVKEVGPEADISWIGKRVIGGINLGGRIKGFVVALCKILYRAHDLLGVVFSFFFL